MDSNWADMVQQFIEEKGASHNPEMWLDLVDEELLEFVMAREAGDDIEALDGLCDLVYVLIGYGLSRGWKVGEAFAEVQRSNMTKGDGGKRADIFHWQEITTNPKARLSIPVRPGAVVGANSSTSSRPGRELERQTPISAK